MSLDLIKTENSETRNLQSLVHYFFLVLLFFYLFIQPKIIFSIFEMISLNEPKCTDDVDLIINAGTAENKLLHDKITEKLSHFKFKSPVDLCYANGIGSLEFRKTLLKLMQISTRRRLNVNNIACASGASSVIRILLSNICKPGDGVMIPTP